METHFGHDFAQVRVHSDMLAGSSAEAVGAHAYTVGQHIAFAPHQYQPHTPVGDRLLRHELAHTLQQFKSSASGGMPLTIGPASDPCEAEADRMAELRTPTATASATPTTHGGVVRRQQANSQTQAGSQSVGATPPAAGAAPSSGIREWAFGIELGHVTTYNLGYADAHLDRSALRAVPQQGSEPPPCELELQLKLQFEFHLGTSPHRLGPNGPMTTPGAPWPQGRSDQWKRNYMNVVQSMWHTRWPMVPANPYAGEPCRKATAHLQIIDVDTMTNAQGQQRRLLGDPAPTAPHVTIQVYEFRPADGMDASHVGGSTAVLYDEDVQPQNAPQPQGFDTTQFTWRPGAASHETGHMLGRPHVSCPPGTPNPNRDECYGAPGSSERQNIMGRGQEFRREDQAPFIAAMRAITGCDWRTASGGLPDWAIGLIVGASILTAAGAALGIAALTGAFSHH
jgi:hypothetical protein